MVTIRKTAREHLERNGATYFFLLLCWVVGITAGTLFVGSVPADKGEALVASMDNFCQSMAQGQVSPGQVFRASAGQYGRMVLVLLLASLTVYLTPLIFIQMGAKGFASGFALCFLAKSYGWKGFALALVSVVPQLLVGLPLLMLLSVLCFHRPLSKNQLVRHTGNERKSDGARFTYSVVFISALLLIGAGVEALVVPVFSNLICGFLVP